MNKNIPFLDLVSLHLQLEDELISVFKDALRTGRFIGGPAVEGFEKEFALFCDTKYCIGVGSGTDALRFALMASGINRGQIVITAPNTFIATAEAISQAGASVAFVDIDEKTYNMDPAKLKEYIETQCKTGSDGRLIHNKTGRAVSAVIPVHLYGQIADMDAIVAIARTYNLKIIEDACQAHGAQYFSRTENRWQTAGSIGHAAAFSFYPGKNLGACGEAGAVTTNDEAMAKAIRMIRDHGQAQKYYHDLEGYNGRLDAIQAGFLTVKLRYLSKWNQQRKENAQRYNELLSKIDGITIPFEPSWAKAVYHLYVIRTVKRNELQSFLSENNIFTGLHYPVPLHLQKAYSRLGHKEGDFPVAEKVIRELLSLPMYPGLTEYQQQQIAERIKQAISLGAGPP